MRTYRNVKFDSQPTMIASWPGMGNVGIISTDYLRSKVDAQILAEIDMTPYFTPDSIVVENGLAELPDLPRSVVYYSRNPDLLIFESNAQVAGKEGISIIKKVLRLATEYNVKRIFTAAAFAQDISHNAPSKILGAYNSSEIMEEFNNLNIEPMPNGFIAGLNGLMLGIAAKHDIDAACFLGTIPSFAANLSYPKASLEIIRLMEQLLSIEIDKKELLESINSVDAQFTEIEERIKTYYLNAISDSDEDSDEDNWKTDAEPLEIDEEVNDEEVPRYIMDKIERLFEDVRKDRNNAPLLKKELDRWKLYELYEHRFLDLFK